MAGPKGSRGLTADDVELWRRVTESVRPGVQNSEPPEPSTSKSKVAPTQKRPAPGASPATQPTKPIPQDPQLDGKTAERLRRGRIEPERTVDLHGLTADRAERLLQMFIAGARRDGLKVVLVITGKGRVNRDDGDVIPQRTGVLRQSLPNWLAAPTLAGSVVKSVPAHPRHGGAGAFYLYLKRNRPRG